MLLSPPLWVLWFVTAPHSCHALHDLTLLKVKSLVECPSFWVCLCFPRVKDWDCEFGKKTKRGGVLWSQPTGCGLSAWLVSREVTLGHLVMVVLVRVRHRKVTLRLWEYLNLFHVAIIGVDWGIYKENKFISRVLEVERSRMEGLHLLVGTLWSPRVVRDIAGETQWLCRCGSDVVRVSMCQRPSPQVPRLVVLGAAVED